MGPLVPDIIGPNLNFIVAIAIGMAFGWILEQAGFSTSKKLVGLFYGYDFTVLRVFFTAGVVAMFGVITLQHFGLLDINLIYINPTYIWAALVGGLIMGLGFVVGGFCPGTSVCAAAIGKIDAMIFIGGSFLGVLLFAEGYPLFENLYLAEYWGNPHIYETTGIPKALFVFLLTAVALLAFWAVSLVEARVNGEQPKFFQLTRITAAVAVVGVLIAFSGFLLPPQKDTLLTATDHLEEARLEQIKTICPDELAFRILDTDSRLQVLDFRPLEAREELPLPNATAFTLDNLFEKEPVKIFDRKHSLNVIVASDEATDQRMAAIARELGHKNVSIIDGGLAAFEREILKFDTTQVPSSRHEIDTYRFRTRARRDLPAVLAAQKPAPFVPKVLKRAAGGC